MGEAGGGGGRVGDRTGGRQKGRRDAAARGGDGEESVVDTKGRRESIVPAERSPQAQYTSAATRCHCKRAGPALLRRHASL